MCIVLYRVHNYIQFPGTQSTEYQKMSLQTGLPNAGQEQILAMMG